MNRIPAVLIALLAGIVGSPVFGAAEAAMPDKAITCAACHGADGKAVLSPYPNLAGQNHDYLVYALKAYRAGDRSAGFANLMQQQATSLTDADIDELANYYSKLK